MSQETIRQLFSHLCVYIKEVCSPTFLSQRPKRCDLYIIPDNYGAIDLSGGIGAVDGMKVQWKNCPISKKGQHHERKEGKMATVRFEAWCCHRLYIWSLIAGRFYQNRSDTAIRVAFVHRYSDGYVQHPPPLSFSTFN